MLSISRCTLEHMTAGKSMSISDLNGSGNVDSLTNYFSRSNRNSGIRERMLFPETDLYLGKALGGRWISFRSGLKKMATGFLIMRS